MAKDLSKGKPDESICTKRTSSAINSSILQLVSLLLFDNPIDKFKITKSRYQAERHKEEKIRKAKNKANSEAKYEALREARSKEKKRGGGK